MAEHVDTLDFFGRLENRLALVATTTEAQGQRLDRLAPADPVAGELCNELGALRIDVAAVVDEVRKLARHVAAVEALTIPAAALAQQMQADAQTRANVVADRRKGPADNVVVMRTWPVVGVPEDVQAGQPEDVQAMDRQAAALATALRAAGRPDLADAELAQKRAAELATELRASFRWDPVTGRALQDIGRPAVDLSALPGLRDMAEDLAARLESRWGSDEYAIQAAELASQLGRLVAGQLPPAPCSDAEAAEAQRAEIMRQLMELRRQGRLVDAQELKGSDLLEMAELQAQALANLANAPALVSLDVLDEISARGQAMLGRLRQLVDTDARAAQTPVYMVLGPLGLIR